MGKKFGQHFLSDKPVLDRIADTVLWLQVELWCESLVEVGPGQWVLTKLIVDNFSTVRLLEIDKVLKPYLTPFTSSHLDLEIIRWDVLNNKDTGIVIQDTLVVGNLPYYITSPIFRKFFCPSERTAAWLPLPPSMGSYPGGVFLIQKEVAQKIATDAKQKSYLRWLLNYEYDITFEFIVSATAFDPPPKVQSAVVSFRRKEKVDIDFPRMIQFLDVVSQYTRKTLRKIWKMRKKDLESFTLLSELEGKRVQELGWEEMSQILSK